ncbi:MAG: Trk system potassium uptake protein TrkA [Candidatus Marinimicrobia bacterium]|nr:Trk system potassium uptake protein TrkA [Candidatus Neomarinimicrobiota bacterium]
MNIVIIGAGDIGFHLSKRLSSEKHGITILEKDKDRVHRASEQLDALVVDGHGASYESLKEAQIENADIVAAMTNNDEVNILACQIAKKVGVPTTIARVRNPEFTDKDFILSEKDLSIDLIIHPEKETAASIVRLIRQSVATDVIEFADGKAQMMGIRVEKGAPVLDIPLKDLAQKYQDIPQRAVAVHRGQRTIIPDGETKFKSGDQLFIVCDPEYIDRIIEITGKSETKIDDVMILGGGLIGQFIARNLSPDINTKIIESNAEKSQEIADILSGSLIIHGDGTDLDLLAMEGLMDMDAFVAVTGDDETNIISTLVGRHLEVPRTIALVNKTEYLPITPTIGMDAVVSKQLITVNSVQRFIRHQMIASIASLPEIDAEIIEYMASAKSRITKKPLKSLRFPKSAIVGAVLRGKEFIIPTGETQIQVGDKVIIFSLPQARDDVEKLFH